MADKKQRINRLDLSRYSSQRTDIVDHDAFQFVNLTANFVNTIPGCWLRRPWICVLLHDNNVLVIIIKIYQNISKHVNDTRNTANLPTAKKKKPIWRHKQENSAKLTNQRVSYAFTSSLFSFHARYILPTSKCQHSYSCILLIFYRPVNSMCDNWVWIQSTGLTLPLRVTPMNNPITLISPVQSLVDRFCYRCMRSSANFGTVFSESQNANALDAEPEPDFNAKWPFKVIEGHPFRCQWRATNGLHSTI